MRTPVPPPDPVLDRPQTGTEGSRVGQSASMGEVEGRWTHEGDVMDHDPTTCAICLRSDRLKFDATTGFHFMPHDSEAAFPLFRLYPIVAER